jgi:hypothetical protein
VSLASACAEAGELAPNPDESESAPDAGGAPAHRDGSVDDSKQAEAGSVPESSTPPKDRPTGSTTTDAKAPVGVDAGAARDAGGATDASSANNGNNTGADASSGPGNHFTSICAGGTVGKDSDAAPAAKLDLAREYAGVKYQAAKPIEILTFKTTMQVPATPTAKQTLFIWPGLQSRLGVADPGRIGNGVLQPVLTWGPSCAPKAPPQGYVSWWMAGMFVKTSCAGGAYMDTPVGDLLEIDMSVKGTNWIQTITNVGTQKTVDFTIDLKGQVQNIAMWILEVPSGESIKPAEDTIFTESVLTFNTPVTSCQPTQAGTTDYFSAPVRSPDGLHCCFDKVILRAKRTK